MRAAPVRVPKAAAVLRRIAISRGWGSELERVEVQLAVGDVQFTQRADRGLDQPGRLDADDDRGATVLTGGPSFEWGSPRALLRAWQANRLFL